MEKDHSPLEEYPRNDTKTNLLAGHHLISWKIFTPLLIVWWLLPERERGWESDAPSSLRGTIGRLFGKTSWVVKWLFIIQLKFTRNNCLLSNENIYKNDKGRQKSCQLTATIHLAAVGSDQWDGSYSRCLSGNFINCFAEHWNSYFVLQLSS